MGQLNRALGADGFRVTQVVFNAADWFFSLGAKTVRFRATDRDWSKWVEDYLAAGDVDMVVIFGCERFRHQVAGEVCHRLGIPVLSMEEGYLRPGFISVEWDGNNRRSPLLNLAADYFKDGQTGAQKGGTEAQRITEESSFPTMAWFGMFYYIIRFVGFPFFHRDTHHRHRPVFAEFFFWVRNFYRRITGGPSDARLIEKLIDHYSGRYYIVPLQVRDDTQLTCAGRGWTNGRLIDESIRSFAENAPADHLLVIKVHPFERGHSNFSKKIPDIARSYGVENRVHVLITGAIGQLTEHSAGMLTINSTSGFSALFRGKPLGVLGEAVYRLPQLAYLIDDDEGLDRFWNEAQPASVVDRAHFRRLIVCHSQMPGDFYLRSVRKETIANIVDRVGEVFKLRHQESHTPLQ